MTNETSMLYHTCTPQCCVCPPENHGEAGCWACEKNTCEWPRSLVEKYQADHDRGCPVPEALA